MIFFLILPGIYGKYKLQCEQVNGRAYFKSGKYGLWWCTNGYWIIGNDTKKGQNFGFVYFKNNVLYPPHKISEWTGRISTNKGWINAGILFDLKGITSSIKYIVLLNVFSEKFYYHALLLLRLFSNLSGVHLTFKKSPPVENFDKIAFNNN